jgi:endonuclease/exonuclease/phosphatase family metal-dependent hydrolase
MRRTPIALLSLSIALLLVAGTVAACSDTGSDGSSTADSAAPRITIVSENLLHGMACAPTSNRCDLPGRMTTFASELVATHCPPVVGAQETNTSTVSDLQPMVTHTGCGNYQVLWDGDPGLDREVVLTKLPVVGFQRFRLAGPLRTALWTRLRTSVGLLDYWVTHLASSSDDRACDSSTCPPPCSKADTLNSCQGRQVVQLAKQHALPDSVIAIGGDMNAHPDSRTVKAIEAAGFVDTHLAAHNSECTKSDRSNCTSGRVDTDLSELRSPVNHQTERIDYIFVGGRRDCSVEEGTGLFDREGNPHSPSGILHPSDHTGVMAVLACSTSSSQRATAGTATFPTTTTTTATASMADAATTTAITSAYQLLFDGTNPDLQARLGALEDSELMRPVFMAQYQQTKNISPRIKVRIDGISMRGADNAAVTYSLLLDGNPVLDHLPGGAIRSGNAWLVTRRTFCDVATQGMTTIPPPCAS